MTEEEKLYQKDQWRVAFEVPKAEMHVHISLAWSAERFLRAVQQKQTNLNADFLTERNQRFFPTLHDHHKTYESVRANAKISQYELADITQSYLERASREGAIYAEISNSYRDPSTFEWQMEAIAAGIDAAHHNTGIEARAVITTLRDQGPEQSEKAANFLAKHEQSYVTCFGLVGDESKDDFYLFKRSMEIAYHDAGLGLSPHVAEQYPANAIGFLDALPEGILNQSANDPRRLRAGHASTTHLSTSLMKEFADKNICVESCPSSNNRIGLPERTLNYKIGDTIGKEASRTVTIDRSLQDYFQDLADHPITDFLAHGIPVCLGSDNPLLQNTNISKEYSQAVRAGVPKESVTQLTRNAIKFANVDNSTRSKLMRKIDTYEALVEHCDNAHATPNGHKYARNMLALRQG